MIKKIVLSDKMYTIFAFTSKTILPLAGAVASALLALSLEQPELLGGAVLALTPVLEMIQKISRTNYNKED